MKKYIPFFKAGMMEEMSYKGATFIWVLITFVQLICVLFLWIAVYQGATETVINGFTFEQVIVYFTMANIFSFTSLDTPTLHDINTEIKDGTIAISFIKPISYRIRFLVRCLGCGFTRNLLFGIPAYLIAYGIFIYLGYLRIESIADTVIYILLFIICSLLAIAINDTIAYICGILCFYTTAAWGLNQTKNVLISFFAGVLVPLSFFPGRFGEVVNFLPFAGLVQNPVYIFIQRVDIVTAAGFVLKDLVWFGLFELLAKLIFINASKKVTVQGG